MTGGNTKNFCQDVVKKALETSKNVLLLFYMNMLTEKMMPATKYP